MALTPKKLSKLRREVKDLRGGLGNIRARELVSLAGKVGRQPQNRGKEPTYECPDHPHWVALTIPQHPGQMAKWTANSILNQIELDLDALEAELGDVDDGEDDKEADESDEADEGSGN